MSAEDLAAHMRDCMKLSAAVVVDGNADSIVAEMIEAGWTYHGVEYREGKRIRVMSPPPGGDEP